MSLTEEEKMDRAGSEKLAQKTGDGGGGSQEVKNIQHLLATVGLPVRVTGVVDAATVEGVNGVFGGWDDAPPKLRAGNLTAKQIAGNLPAVHKYLRLAVEGMQEFR